MKLTADALLRVLAVFCGEPEGPEEAVLMLRREQPTFAPTLYAVWRNEGSPLNPALRYELDVQDERMRRYRALSADLVTRVPDIVSLKGLEIADLYPAGLTRYMNDLDYVVADEPRMWRLVGELIGDGWDMHTATFVMFDGALHVLVCLRMPHEDPYCLPYGIEVTSFVALGDLAGVPPMLELPPAWRDPVVKNLLMLLFERFEQPYRARDLVDAGLMLDALSASGASGARDTLRREIDRIGLWPEYAELISLLDRAELVAIPAGLRPSAVSAVTDRARRARRRIVGLRQPGAAAARHLQRGLVIGSQSGPERLLWAAAERRLPAGRALRAGLLCFGLPLPGPAPDVATSTVRQLDELTYVDTPVARFLLTAGDDVDQDAMDRLTLGGESAGAPAVDPTSQLALAATRAATKPAGAPAP